MKPTIGNLDSGEEQGRKAGKSLNIDGKMEKNGPKSETIGGKLEKNGSKSESIGRKIDKTGPVRWASMALCWGGRCLINKKQFSEIIFMATLIMHIFVIICFYLKQDYA